MNVFHRRLGMTIALVALMLSACGDVNVAGGGTGGTGISYGTVTQFGSVYVNGVRYNTDNAQITLDGLPGAGINGGLKIGMVVRVNGTIDASRKTGTAKEISYTNEIEGPITSITTVDANTKQVSILGQLAIIDTTQTRYDNTSFSALVRGNVVEISGLRDAGGRIRASYVEKKADSFLTGMKLEVNGLVGTVNTALKTLRLFNLTVSYGGALMKDFSGSDPMEGQRIEVKGFDINKSGELVASVVELKRPSLVDLDAEKAEIEGFVTEFVSSAQFTIGDQMVVTDANTVFLGGTPDEIVRGSKLEAEGRLSGGVLTATKVSFEESVSLEGDIAAPFDAGSGQFRLNGLSSIAISVNGLTEFDGASNLSGFAAGDHVEVRGRKASAGGVLAVEMKKKSASNRIILQGALDSAPTPPLLVICGVTVDTSVVPDSDFRGDDDRVIGRSAFFAASNVGTLVKARGTLGTTGIAWERMELEGN